MSRRTACMRCTSMADVSVISSRTFRSNPSRAVGPVSIDVQKQVLPGWLQAAATMKRPEYTITVRVGKGRGVGHYWTCDLGHEYVRINADYRT